RPRCRSGWCCRTADSAMAWGFHRCYHRCRRHRRRRNRQAAPSTRRRVIQRPVGACPFLPPPQCPAAQGFWPVLPQLFASKKPATRPVLTVKRLPLSSLPENVTFVCSVCGMIFPGVGFPCISTPGHIRSPFGPLAMSCLSVKSKSRISTAVCVWLHVPRIPAMLQSLSRLHCWVGELLQRQLISNAGVCTVRGGMPDPGMLTVYWSSRTSAKPLLTNSALALVCVNASNVSSPKMPPSPKSQMVGHTSTSAEVLPLLSC